MSQPNCVSSSPVYKFLDGNLPQFKHYAECACGFQTRQGTEAAAKSQLDNHRTAHGFETFFEKLAPTVAGEKQETPKAEWKPVGAK